MLLILPPFFKPIWEWFCQQIFERESIHWRTSCFLVCSLQFTKIVLSFISCTTVPGIEPITKVTSLQSTIWSNSCHLVSRPSSLSQSSAFVRFYFYAVFWFILTVYSKVIVFESIKWTSSFRLVCSQQSSNTVCCFPILLSNALMVSPWNFSDIWETINSLENFLTLGLLSLR